MRRFTSLVFCLLMAAPALADINFTYTPSTPLYVRVKVDASTSKAFALTEGSGQTAGYYTVADSTLDDQLMTASHAEGFPSGYPFKIFVGSTPSTTNPDPWVGHGELPWSGSAELPQWADVRHWLGVAVSITVPGVPQVDVTHLLGSPVCD